MQVAFEKTTFFCYNVEDAFKLIDKINLKAVIPIAPKYFLGSIRFWEYLVKSVDVFMYKSNKKKHYNIVQVLSFASQVGFTMAACVFVGVFIGKYLDEKLSTSPWLLLTFSLIGVLAALMAIFNMNKEDSKKDEIIDEDI